ncbi:hypothetical protein BMS3Abin15_00452 [bacterium BMS3Abin15]|nr:hypothetical protein BMS3Abin15_00452 [bacterium BMS3Abin15]HDZ85904.1 hypothetical protein [Candidatus Moranbacteria bacterium]
MKKLLFYLAYFISIPLGFLFFYVWKPIFGRWSFQEKSYSHIGSKKIKKEVLGEHYKGEDQGFT